MHHQQQQQHDQGYGTSSSSSSSGTTSIDSDGDAEQLAVLLMSAADKLYKQRLRDLHALMSPEGLMQLQLTRQQFDSLQVGCSSGHTHCCF